MHGRSSTSPSGYDLGDQAKDLAALIRHVDLAPVVLIAHSMGSSVSIVLAIRHPELVHALALVDPDYAGDPGKPEWMALIARPTTWRNQTLTRSRRSSSAIPCHLLASLLNRTLIGCLITYFAQNALTDSIFTWLPPL